MTTAGWFDAVASLYLDPAIGCNHAYAAGSGGSTPAVEPMTDQAVEPPFAVLSFGGGPIDPGSWERTRFTLTGAIWVNRDPVAQGYAALIGLIEPVRNTFAAHSKAKVVDPVVQSLLITEFGAIEAREWPAGSNRWYLVLPQTIEVIVSVARTYLAA